MPRLLIILLTFSAAFTMRAAVPNVQYHDEITEITDTTVTFTLPTNLRRITMQARCAFTRHSRPDGRRWGIAWGPYTATVTRGRDDVHDLNGLDFLTLTLLRGDSVLRTCRVDKHVNTHPAAYNCLQVTVEPATGRTTLSLGSKHLKTILDTVLPYPEAPTRWGITTNAHLNIRLAATSTQPDRTASLETDWTLDSLQKHLAVSPDPIEGIYEYFDRDAEESLAIVGGRYRIAVVATGRDEYDLIYISGARTNSRMWHSGMLRGRLRGTPFVDNYYLLWYDASGLPVDGDTYATREADGALLVLHFPEYSTLFRLARVRK